MTKIEINDEFVDVDFESDPNYVFGDATDYTDLDNFAEFGDVVPEMSWSEIEKHIEEMDENDSGLEWLVSRIYNQKREGSCVANAYGGAMEVILAQMYGIANVTHLSAISLYKRIGRSPSSGATISGGYEEGRRRGILPLENDENKRKYDHVMPNTGFHLPFPRGWESTAAQFTIPDAYVCRSDLQIWTALAMRWPVVVGRQGHAIFYVRPLPGRKALYPNSWSENWGQGAGNKRGGFGVDSASQVRMSGRYAVALRGVGESA